MDMNLDKLANMTLEEVKIGLVILLKELKDGGVLDAKKDIDTFVQRRKSLYNKNTVENERSRTVVERIATKYKFPASSIVYTSLGYVDRKQTKLPHLSKEDFIELTSTHNYPIDRYVTLSTSELYTTDEWELRHWYEPDRENIIVTASVIGLRRLGYHVETVVVDNEKYVYSFDLVVN